MNNIHELESVNSPDLLDMHLGPWLSPHLRAATMHALDSRGGGFRACLVQSLCEACGLGMARSQAFSTSLEYFHLASLVLDDLPCMDDAEVRRGKPCTHRVYGDSMAILCALALINRSYFLLWEGLSGLSQDVQRSASVLIDQCLGLNGILNGQALDLKFATTDRSPVTIERIAGLKTGSLIRLSILLPWIACNGNTTTKKILIRLADSWGLVYQLLDDFKDVECGERASGKTPLRDELLDRPNLAIALGPELAVERLRGHLAGSRKLLDLLDDKGDLVKILKTFQQKLEKSGKEFIAKSAA